MHYICKEITFLTSVFLECDSRECDVISWNKFFLDKQQS